MTEEVETTAAAVTETAETTTPAVTEKPAEQTAATEQKPATETPAEAKGDKKTIATGAEEAKKEEPAKSYWPDDWREKLAEHISAGNKKEYDKELKRLQRITDPSGIYGQYRDLEAKFTGGGLVKIPGKGATDEEIAAYHKALGVPEKPEDYLKDIKLDNGVVIGDADKPLVDGFVQAVHKSGATPAAVNAALNWYYKNQEDQAAALDEQDDTFRRESETALKEEWGPAFKRRSNAIGTLFATAPGGVDVKNEQGLFAQLMGGRMADGSVIGNNPVMLKWLDSLRNEINPAATVVEGGDQTGMTLDAEIAKIEGIMRTDRREYNRTYATRYGELLAAREKIQARGR
jgi:hypothetical protein